MANLDNTTDPQTVDSTMTDEDIHNLASKLKGPGSQAILEQMGKVANDPKYAATVPADTQKTLQQALDDAKQAYQARVGQNEWLDVAQTLGRAVAQFGAAHAGMAGGNRHDMSNINMGQPIDYSARSDRAFHEYAQAIGNAKDLANNARQNSQDEQQRQRFELGKQQDFLDKGLRAATASEQQATSETNADKRVQYQTNAERQRLEQQDKRAAEREMRSERRLNVQDLDKQANDLSQKLLAARTLANEAVSDEDLSKRSKDALAQKYGPLAAKAGIDPGDLASISEQAKDKGILGTGLFRSEDKAKKAALLDKQVVAPIKNMLDAIHARRRDLISNSSQAPAPDAAPPPPGGGSDPQIQKYADQYKLSYDDAKKVLVGRGYKPAE